jgi:hypothetical protein
MINNGEKPKRRQEGIRKEYQQIGEEKLRICSKRPVDFYMPDMNHRISVHISFKDLLCVLSDGNSLYVGTSSIIISQLQKR